MIQSHYIDCFIKTRSSKQGMLNSEVIDLKGYAWRKAFKDPFSDRKGAFIKTQKIKRQTVIHAYFFL